MSKAYVIATAFSLMLGCYAAYVYTPPIVAVVGAVTATLTALLLLRKNKRVVVVCICVLALLIGILRITIAHNNRENVPLISSTRKVSVEGVVTGDIETGDSYDRYIVKVISVDGSEVKSRYSVLVYEPYPTECVPGEYTSFSGLLREPENFLGSGGRIFNYKEYLSQRDIYATTFIQESSCEGKRKEHSFFAGMRKFLVDAMRKVLPTEEASLLSGLILGLRGSLSPDLLDAFRVTGLIHIIVLSGYNVTLVAETVRRLFSWTPRKISFLLSLTMIVLFVLLAGAQTAAVRAGSMATIALIARATHREYDGIRALTLIAVLMTLINPNQVLFNISFHLSFLATLGLLLFSPICERVFHFLPQRFEIRGVISATVATQIFLLPYLAYAIGEVSVIGIPANILILPIIPAAMLFGSVVTVLATVLPSAALVIAPIAYLPLRAIILLTETLAGTPRATLQLPELPAPLTMLLTAFLILIGYEYAKNVRGKEVLEQT